MVPKPSTGTSLFVVTAEELPGALGSRNLANVELTTTDDCTAADLATHARTVFTKAALELLTTEAKPTPVKKEPAAKKPVKKTATKRPAKKSTKPAPKRKAKP